jgi:hypothetical protein
LFFIFISNKFYKLKEEEIGGKEWMKK